MARLINNLTPDKRHWVATCWNMEYEWDEFWWTGKCTYMVIGSEKTTEGKPHWQCAFQFVRTRTSEAKTADLFRDATPAEVKIARWPWSKPDNEYCMKEGNWREWGLRPKPVGKRQGARTDITLMMADIKDGKSELEIMDLHPEVYGRFGRMADRYRNLLRSEPRDGSWKTEVRVWWGEAGSGKTQAAIAWLQEDGQDWDDVAFSWSGGQSFFNGYTNSHGVLFDDFGPGTMMPRDLFLKVTDRYRVTCNMKYVANGSFNAKKIAITSNVSPETWYEGGGGEAFKRRIDVVTRM